MICDESSANSSYIGTTKAENRAAVISHDNQVLMYFAAKTRDHHSNPAPKVQKRFNVIHKGYDNIRREPIPDFRSLFTLVSLHLSQPAISIRAVSRINGSYHLKPTTLTQSLHHCTSNSATSYPSLIPVGTPF